MTRSPAPREWPVVSALRPLDAASLDSRLSVMLAEAKWALADEFVGITTDGCGVPGLFPVRPTGLSAEPLATAAEEFLATLSAPQRAAVCQDLESTAWRSWSNIHPNLMRHGLCLHDLGGRQRRAALELLRASLSDSGWRSARDVMWLNGHLGELVGRPESYGEWFYWLSIMGTPSPTRPWGWQIDGHHLIVNCFVLGDQIILTPTFMGSEPVRGYGAAGEVRVFADEERLGLAMMTSLDSSQRKVATLGDTPVADLFAGAFASCVHQTAMTTAETCCVSITTRSTTPGPAGGVNMAPLEDAVNRLLAGQVSVRSGWAASRLGPSARSRFTAAGAVGAAGPAYGSVVPGRGRDPAILASDRGGARADHGACDQARGCGVVRPVARRRSGADRVEPHRGSVRIGRRGSDPVGRARGGADGRSRRAGRERPAAPAARHLRQSGRAVSSMRTVREVMARLAGRWRVEVRQMLAPLMHGSSRSRRRPTRPAAAERPGPSPALLGRRSRRVRDGRLTVEVRYSAASPR